MLATLEQAAGEGGIVLRGEGVFIDGTTVTPVALQFDAPFQGGVYVETGGARASFTRDALRTRATAGEFVGTFTARLGANVDVDHPQPAVWARARCRSSPGHSNFRRCLPAI